MTDEDYEAELRVAEDEWLTSDDPRTLHRCTFGRASGRKYRLLCVASCRCLEAALDETYWRLLDRCEQAADASLSADDEKQLEADAWQYIETFSGRADWPAARYAASAIYDTSYRSYDDAFDSIVSAGEDAHITLPALPRLCAILREVFGNPFRPVTFESAWRTSDVMLLARGIYEEKAFDRMPILADALQDAGCDSDALLNHLRDVNATHVRGCWALDLVLGKE